MITTALAPFHYLSGALDMPCWLSELIAFICHLASAVTAIGAERRGVSWRGKKGVVTSAHPFNHHFQGRGVKTHIGNDFPEAVSNGRFYF